MQQDLDRAYAEASHYIAMGADNFSVHVGDIEILSYKLPESKPRDINRYEVKRLAKKVNNIFRRQNESEN